MFGPDVGDKIRFMHDADEHEGTTLGVVAEDGEYAFDPYDAVAYVVYIESGEYAGSYASVVPGDVIAHSRSIQ